MITGTHIQNKVNATLYLTLQTGTRDCFAGERGLLVLATNTLRFLPDRFLSVLRFQSGCRFSETLLLLGPVVAALSS